MIYLHAEAQTRRSEKVAEAVLEKIGDSLALLIGAHAFAVFTADGDFDSGHDNIETAQDAAHRLPPGNIVVRHDGVVLSVGVPPFNPRLLFDRNPGKPDSLEIG